MSAESDLYARAQKCWWNVSISINSTDVLISIRNSGPEEKISLSLKSKFLTRVGQGPPAKKKSSFLRNHGIVHPSNFPHQWALIFDGARWQPAKVVRRARIFSLRCRHMVASFEWKTAFHTDRLFARQKRFIMVIVPSKPHNFFIHPPTHLIRNKSNHNETETQNAKWKIFSWWENSSKICRT